MGVPITRLTILLPAIAVATTNDLPRNAKASPTASTAAIQLVQIRGKVICLPEEMHQLYQAALPTGHPHLYGFKTEDRNYYTLLRTKFSEALFADPRFREKQLLLKGRIFPDTRVFEVTTIRSIREGRVYDLYYYCDVCDIQAVAPGLCECCQGATELVEKPLGE